jgi:hypothetical protein
MVPRRRVPSRRKLHPGQRQSIRMLVGEPGQHNLLELLKQVIAHVRHRASPRQGHNAARLIQVPPGPDRPDGAQEEGKGSGSRRSADPNMVRAAYETTTTTSQRSHSKGSDFTI